MKAQCATFPSVLLPMSMPDLRASSIWERRLAMSMERRESSTVDCRLRAGGASGAPGSAGTWWHTK